MKQIEDLISVMTLEEKVSLLAGADFWHTRAIERLGIPSIKMTDGPHGARTVDDTGHTLPGNCYPTGSALASTWNTELIRRVGEAIGEEVKAKGCCLLLGPCVNIQRSPLGGRNFESYSEDPYLSARMAVAFINGVQSKGVGACVKHYALNNSEFQRFTISSEADERTIREIYLPSFEAAVKEAGTWTLMSSYNKVNGTYASENVHLLTEILKGEWGFDGAVISDWFGTYSTVPPANAGLDVEMPGPGRFFGDALLTAIKEGKVTAEVINDKVRRILGVILKSRAMEATGTSAETSSDTPEHRALARESAGEAIVLLKNKGNILPLKKNRLKTLAVIGHNALEARIEGSGSSRVTPYYAVSPLESLKRYCGDAVNLVYELGCKNGRHSAPIEADQLLPAGNHAGNGLVAEYYTSADLSGQPFLTRVEKKLSFVWGGAVPQTTGPDVNRDMRSLRLTGKFKAGESGLHTFSILTNGFARLLIDNVAVLEQVTTTGVTGLDAPTEISGAFTMCAGSTHDITVEYRRDPSTRWGRFRLGCEPPASADLIERAVKAAASADVALVFAGTNDEWESEGFDRVDMELPGKQAELIEKVAAVNKKTVVVLNNGAPLAMERWIDKVAAVVEAWFPGQECGNAITDVLFGDTNPSGRLPVTFPKRLEDNPAFINYPGENGKVLYGEGLFVGYRYYDAKKLQPLFPFGHGLSYTRFDYTNLTVNKPEFTSDEKLEVAIDVTNTGKLPGKEVIQLYIADIESSLKRPPLELKGFQKVFLKPGETKRVKLVLDGRSFSFYDPAKGTWVAEPGEFQVLVGSSSRDIRASASVRLV